ncbi:MAG: hypothetical protein J1F64_06295 [Oscillospiraceae bacterium]|nr:hypothetical protein [Oscillospiraceae bacterium]
MMKIFFIGLTLNIFAGLFNIPLGPERYIKRLYRSAYSLINIDFDDITRKIADTVIYIAVSLYIFFIVWILSEIYNVIPGRFTRIAVLSFLVCLLIRPGDNIYPLILLKCGRKKRVVKILDRRFAKLGDDASDTDIFNAMLASRGYNIRLFACPVFFFMCFGIIPAFLCKTAEILSRTKNNCAAKAVYGILSFIPAVMFRFFMRLSGLILKGHIPKGNSVYKLVESHTGIKIGKDNAGYKDVLKSEILICMSDILFCAAAYGVSAVISLAAEYLWA